MDAILIKKIFLALHIAGGGTALIVGIVPMIAQKGGKLHRRAGWVYTAAMVMMFITSVILSTVLPIISNKPINSFLLFIGVFSIYFVFSGLRGLRFQRPRMEHGASAIDYMAAGLLVLLSLVLLFLAFVSPSTLAFQFNPIALIFALFGTRLGIGDIARFHRPYDKMVHKQRYFLHHLIMMCSSYISAATAFVVVNARVDHPIIVWIGPGLIGGIFIGRWVRYYKKKFEVQQAV